VASLDERSYGLLINSLIISIGKADNPTPPNNTKKIHPINESRAMQYIGKLTSYSTVELLVS